MCSFGSDISTFLSSLTSIFLSCLLNLLVLLIVTVVTSCCFCWCVIDCCYLLLPFTVLNVHVIVSNSIIILEMKNNKKYSEDRKWKSRNDIWYLNFLIFLGSIPNTFITKISRESYNTVLRRWPPTMLACLSESHSRDRCGRHHVRSDRWLRASPWRCLFGRSLSRRELQCILCSLWADFSVE